LRNRKTEYFKDKVKDLAANSNNRNIRDLYRKINEFKRVYKPKNTLVKDLSPLEVEITVAKLEKYKLVGNDHILAELLQAGGECLNPQSQ
jgi:hypothetical protein